jgi:hypothetical protein
MSDKLDKDIQRGLRAQNLLNDDLFAEASDHIDAECFRLFKASHPTDDEALRQIAGIQYLHTKYKAFLKAAVTNGKVAQLEVERRSALERMKRKVFG